MDWNLNLRLKQEWTDQFVEADSSRPELKRFEGIVGRVVTVNMNNKCIVDFQDGAWYDIDPAFLRKIPKEEGQKRYNSKANSAQPIPARQS
ncbi:MAG: hypothetical protein C4297_03755 [Gemmataceae bacterium]